MSITTRRSISSTAHVQRRAVVRRSLILAGLAVLGVPGVAAAADAAGGGWVGPFAVLAAGFALGLAAGLCGLGQGKAIASSVDAMARQPGAAARIQTAMIIGLALIESLTIYVLVVAMILLFVQPVK
jgi:F-type H+-transporting ATPase subunit c